MLLAQMEVYSGGRQSSQHIIYEFAETPQLLNYFPYFVVIKKVSIQFVL